ncbi:hypothetical protein ACFV08_26810, partial [Streptomyces fradiae]
PAAARGGRPGRPRGRGPPRRRPAAARAPGRVVQDGRCLGVVDPQTLLGVVAGVAAPGGKAAA